MGTLSDQKDASEGKENGPATDKVDDKPSKPQKPSKLRTDDDGKPSMTDGNASFLRAARAGNLDKVLEYLKGSTDINTSNANGLNALHLSSKEGHLNIVTELLKRGANVNAATKKGNTALHIGALAGQEEIVKVLIDHGADVNVQSQNGFTPLYMAAQENHTGVVKYLLSHNADQNLATEDGFTPLAVALQQGHDKVVAVLLENDRAGKTRLPALHIAARKDDTKAAALLLQSGHNPDVTSKSGFTPLHIAAHYGHVNVATLLLQKGATVDYSARNHITPLHVAAKWGRVNMVNTLLDRGAKIDAKTRDGLTPLHCSARSGHDQCVDQLLERGAPISTKTKSGLAPLHMAAQGDHVDSARLLLFHKAPVDDVTVDYLTPLHVAAHCGHHRVAKLLLDRKATPDARALNGFTPLHIACKKNRIKVIELLLKYGASIHATTESGLTPLHAAAFMGNVQIVPYLIKHGAKVNETNVRGETPLHLAARSNQIDVMKILIDNGATVDARAHENQTPLHIAARLGNAEIVTLLLENGANADAQTRDQYTALHIAAREGKEDVAAVLLDRGATLSMKTKKDFTPLHVAAKYGRLEVASLLLRNYAAPDAKAQNGLTPLHIAAHYDNVDVAMLLLDHGASPHTAAKNGFTPLHIAAKKNQMDVATTLLEYGAEPNATTKHGISPVHLAALEGHSDMLSLLLERGAKPNIVSKNGLTPLHLAAQEDQLNCAVILVNSNAEIDPKTKAGYTPLHVACHYGNIKTATYLLEHNANVHEKTKHGLTPLHQGAQQGHVGIVNTLLTHNADPNEKANNGYTPLAIAKRLGYISVVNTLTIVTEETEIVVSPNDEKLKVQVPETMQVNFMSDSDDEGDDVSMTGDQIVLSPQEIRTMADDSETARKSWEDDWMREPNMNYFSGVGSLSGHYSMSSPQGTYLNVTSPSGYSTLDSRYGDRTTNGDITIEGEAPIVMSTDTTLESAPPMLQSTPYRQISGEADNDTGPRSFPTFHGFLISFIVDARGGTMRSKRLPGLRLVVPPKRASGPTRVTCRLIKRNKLQTPPPLVENEALSTRVIEVGPSNTQFLGPVLLEVPHFASLRGNEREIVVLRSDNGETWREHSLGATDEEVKKVMDGYEAEDEKLSSDKRICRIITKDFPQYFAIISRVRQETNIIGTQGGMLNSTVVPQVQAVFPEGTLTKKIKVGLQAQPVSNDVVKKVLGNRVMVSPIVTIEPRRRKFHKPITVTIPVPTAYNQGVNTYGGDTPTLRLLCSISGGTAPAQWEDITGTTPLTFVNDCVSFTTTVSARFWLMDCKEIDQASNFARELYQELKAVPFMSKFVVFAKTHDPIEARVRVFCVTDDKIDKPLEQKEEFKEVARSKDVEVMDGRPVYFELAGNLVPVQKSGEQLHLNFHAFHENRLPFFVRVRDQTQEPCGRLSFMREPRVQRGLPPQVPVCSLNVTMPPYVKVKKATDSESESESESEDEDYKMEKGEREQYQQDILLSNLNFDYIKDKKKYTFPEESSRSPETRNKPEIILWDISNKLGSDWPALGRELGINDREIKLIENENDDLPEQAFVVMHLWAERQGPNASTAPLADALQSIGRGDIVDQCLPKDKPLDVTVTSTTSFSPLRGDLESPRDGHTDITIDITGVTPEELEHVIQDQAKTEVSEKLVKELKEEAIRQTVPQDIDEHFAEKHEEEQKEVEQFKVKTEGSSPEEQPKEPTLVEDSGQMEEQTEPESQETTTIKEVTKQKVVHFEEHVYVETGREELKPDIEDIRVSDDIQEDVPVEEMPVEVSTLEVSEVAPKRDEVEDTEPAVEEIPVTETKEDVEESPRPMQEDDEERTIALIPEAETVPVETKEVLEQIVAEDEERQDDVSQDIYHKQILTEVTVTEQVVVESIAPSQEEKIPSETVAQAVLVSKEIPDEETDLKDKELEDELPKETSDEPDVVGERIDEEEAEKPVETIEEEEESKEIPQERDLELRESVVSIEEERVQIPEDSGLAAEEPTETVEEVDTEKIPDTSVPEQLDVTEEQKEQESEQIISVVSIQDERAVIQEESALETETPVETFETQDQVGTEEVHEESIPVSEPGGAFIEETFTEEEREVPQETEPETIVSVVTVEQKITAVQEESVTETEEPVRASDKGASEEIPEESVPESEPVETFEEEKEAEEIPEERKLEQVVSVEEKTIDTQEETVPETEEPVENEVVTEEVPGESVPESEPVETFEGEKEVEVPEEIEPEQAVSDKEEIVDIQEESVPEAEPKSEEPGLERESVDAFEEEKETGEVPEEHEPEQIVSVEEKTTEIQEEIVLQAEEPVQTSDEVVTEEIPEESGPIPEREPVDLLEDQKETRDIPEESGPQQVVSLVSVVEKTVDTQDETVPETEEPVETADEVVTEEIPDESVSESEPLETFEGEKELEEVPDETEPEQAVSVEEKTDIQEESVPEAEPKTEEPIETTDEVATEEITDKPIPKSEPVEAFEVQKEREDTPEESGPEQVSVVSVEEKTIDTRGETVPEIEEPVETPSEEVSQEIPDQSITESEQLETFEGERETEEVPEEGEPEQVVSFEEEMKDIQEDTVPEAEEPVDTTDEVTAIIPDESVPKSETGEAFEGEKETEKAPEETEPEEIVSVVSLEEKTVDIQEEHVPETEEPVQASDERVAELDRESEPVEILEVQKEIEDTPEDSEPKHITSVEEKTIPVQEETSPKPEEHVETTDEVVTEEVLDKSVPQSEPVEIFEREETEDIPEESGTEQVVSVEEQTKDIEKETVPETEEPTETTDEVVPEVIPDESILKRKSLEEFEGEKEMEEVPEGKEEDHIVSVEEKAIDIQEETVPETGDVVTEESLDESVPETKPEEEFEEEEETEKVPEESESEQVAADVLVEEKTPQIEGLVETTDEIVTDKILDKSAPEDEPGSEEREPEEIVVSVVSITEEKSEVQVDSALESERPVDKIEEVSTEESPGDGGHIIHDHEKKEPGTEEIVTEDIPKESLSEDQETDAPDGIVPDQVEAIDAFEEEQEGRDSPSEPLHTFDSTTDEPGLREEECTEPFQEGEGSGDVPEETDARAEELVESSFNEDETIDQEREVTSAMIFYEKDEPITTLKEDKTSHESTDICLPGEQQELDEVPREEEKFLGIPDEIYEPGEDPEEGLFEQEEPKEDLTTEELVDKESLEEHKFPDEPEKDERESETQEEVMDFTTEETAREDEEPMETEDELKMVEALPEEIIPEQDEEVEGYEVDKITKDTIQSDEEPEEPTTEHIDDMGPSEDVVEDVEDAADEQFQDDTYAHERYFEELQNIPEEPEEVSGEDSPAKDSTDMVPEDTGITDSVVHVEETRQTIVKEDESGTHTESVKTVITTTTQVVSSSETLMDEYPVEGTAEQEPYEAKTEEAVNIPPESLETFEQSKPLQEEDYPVESEDIQEGAFTSQVEEPHVETPEKMEERNPDEELAPLEHEITDEPQPGEHVHVQETRQTIVKEDESGVHTESVRTVITTTRVVSSSEILMDDHPIDGTVEHPGEEDSTTPSEPMENLEESKPIGEAVQPVEPEVPEDLSSSQVEEPHVETPEELEERKRDEEFAPLEHEITDEPQLGEQVHVQETRQTIVKEDESGVHTESVRTVVTTTRVVSSSELLMDEYPVEGTVEQPEQEEPKIASEPIETSEECKPVGEEDYPMEPEDEPEDVSSSQVEEPFIKTPEEFEESKPDELASLEHEGKVEDTSHPGEHVHVEETRQTIIKEDESGVQTESVKTVITTTRVVSSSELLMDEYPVEGTVEQPEEGEPKIASEPKETFEESKPIGEEDYPMEPEDEPEGMSSSQVEEPFVKTPEEMEESKPDVEPTLLEHETDIEDTVQQEVVEDEEVQPQLDADEKLVTPEVKEDFSTNEDEVEIEMEAVEENIRTEISPDDEHEVFAPPEDISDQGDDALDIPPGEEYFTQTTEVRIHTEITTSEGTRIHDEKKVIEDGEVKVDVKVDTVKGDSEGEELLGAVKDDGIDETQLGSQPSEVISDELIGQDAQKSEVVMKEGSLPDDEDMSSEEGEYMPEIRVDPSSDYILPKEDEDEPDHGTDGLLVEPDPFTEESDVSMDEREVTREPTDEQPDEDNQLPDIERTGTIETSMSHTQILQGGVVTHTETHFILSGDTAKPSDQEPQDEEPEIKETDETPVIHDELLEQSIILKSEVCLESSPREEKEEPEDRPKTPEIADITEHEEFSPYFQDQEYHQRVSDIQVPDADVEVEFPEISPEDDVEMDLPEPPLHPYAEDQESDLPSREVHTSTTVITSTVRHISSGPDGSVTETSTRTVTRYEDGEKITAPTELRFEEAPPVGADSVQTPEIQELPDTPDSIPGSPLIGAAYVSQHQELGSTFQEKAVAEDEPQEEQEPVAQEDIEIPEEAAVAPVFMDGPTESDYYDANLLVTHHQPQQDDTDRVEPDASEPVQEESLDVGADQEHSEEEVLDEAVASQDEPHPVELEEPPSSVDVSLEQRDEERYPLDEPEQQPESGVEAERDQRRDEGESILAAGAVGMSLSVLSMETKSGKDEAEGIEEAVRPEEVSEEPPSVEKQEDQIESEEVEYEERKRETLEELLPESERAAADLDQMYDETLQYATQPEEYSRGDEGEETEPESEQAFAAEIAPEGSVTMESGDDILESELTEEHEMPLEESVEEETPTEVVTEDQQIERDYQTQEVLVEMQDDDVSKHISVTSMTSTQTVFRSTLLTTEGFVTEEDELADSIVKPTPPEDVEKAEGEIKTPDEDEKDEVPEVLKKTEESEQLEEGKEVDDVDSPTKPVALPVSEREQTTKMVTEGEQQMVVSQLISLEASSAREGTLIEPPVDESLDAPLRVGQDEESKPKMDPSTVQDLADIMNEMDSGGPAEDDEVPEDYDTGELIEEQSMGSTEQSQPPEEAPKVRLTPEDEKELQELWSMEWPDPGEKPISSNMAQQAESAPPASSGPQEESAPPPQRVIQVESAPQPQDSYQVESGPPGDSEDPDGGRLVINFNPGAQTGPTGFNLNPDRERELQEFWEEGTKDQPSAEQSKEEDDGPKVMEDVAPRGLPPASTHRKFNLTEDDEKKLQEFWEEEPPAPDAEPEQSQPTADGIQLVAGEMPPGDDDVTEEVEVEEFEEELPDGTIRKVIRKRIKRSTVQMVPIEVDPANLPPGGTHNIVVHKKVTKNTVVRDGEEVDTTENVETEIEQDGIVTDAAELRDDLQQLVDQFLSDGTVDGAQIISDEQEVVDESDI